MRLLNARGIMTAGLLMVMGSAPSLGVAAPRDRDHAVAQEGVNGNGPAPLPASQIQVSGTTNNFTVSAQRADVLSLLKLVFDQAHRQFVPDASVTGDVTFALSGQKFDVVLASICKQAFLRYDVDKNGVYQFRRDDDALRNLILRTRAINAALQEQLRRMGYAVPVGSAGSSFGAGGFGGGMSGGGVAGRTASSAHNFSNRLMQDSYGRGRESESNLSAGVSRDQNAVGLSKTQKEPAPSQQSPFQQSSSQQSPSQAPKRSEARARSANGPQGVQGPQGPEGSPGQVGDNKAQSSSNGVGEQRGLGTQDYAASITMGRTVPLSLNLDDDAQYKWFLRQNRLVTINTKGQGASVRDVLLDLGKQTGVTILIDPAVPRGTEFVVNASIPPRPLNEVLNLLAYQAHLEWRWLNNQILITTTPQLLLYLRGTQLPTVGGITVQPQRAAVPQNAAPTTDKKADGKTEQADKDKPKGN